MSPKRGLLLCFDAFGTLFFPKAPIAALYGEVARRHGITAFTEEALHGSFRYAFKKAVKENPNYGKAVGMGATQWWRDVGLIYLPKRLRRAIYLLGNSRSLRRCGWGKVG